jgi:hypothetical protein
MRISAHGLSTRYTIGTLVILSSESEFGGTSSCLVTFTSSSLLEANVRLRYIQRPRDGLWSAPVLALRQNRGTGPGHAPEWYLINCEK